MRGESIYDNAFWYPVKIIDNIYTNYQFIKLMTLTCVTISSTILWKCNTPQHLKTDSYTKKKIET